MKTRAFSLSEMVAIIVVLGIIFALIFPSTMSSIEKRVLSTQKKTFDEKFTRGMQTMRMQDKLAIQYASTDDFVNAMVDYFQIAKTCDSNHLSECFSSGFTATTTYDNGNKTLSKKYNLNETKTAKNLSSTFSDDDSNVVGVKFSDGTSALIAYKPNCIGPSKTDVNGNVFECIGYIADTNGNKAPNTTGSDLLTNMILIEIPD